MKTKQNNLYIAYWLFACAFMIIIMTLIGGITRLTNSGLSITEWQILSGIFPPINNNSWLLLFEKYKLTPEYRIENYGMSLDEFKFIFWLEYIHRLVGRITGLIFFIPLVVFAIQKKLSKDLLIKLLIILSLGLLQGFIGWYMVASGLIDKPSVSHYRLAKHLLMAFILFSLIFLLAISYLNNDYIRKIKCNISKQNFYICISIIVLTFIQVMFGAFVAGTHAGLIYNDFPFMNGEIIAKGAFDMKPLIMNFGENIILIQFTHRVIALLLLLSIYIFATYNLAKYRKFYPKILNYAIYSLIILISIQFGLGVVTLMTSVNIIFASAHQVMALFLLANMLFIAFIFYKKLHQ